ncbi:MAG: ATPase [Chitinophagaceae bacterium]|nr:MAG: ATPase [Chitinophagaceae bacterium]
MTKTIFPATGDCEIVSSRSIDAPIGLVWAAWTDPAQLARWWGPAGFRNSFHAFDLRVGGTWRFTMHGPEGKGHYENECVFTHIDAPRLLAWDRVSKPHFRVVATFSEEPGGRTRVQFRQVFDSAEACGKLRPHVTGKNEENLDRLEAELEPGRRFTDSKTND